MKRMATLLVTAMLPGLASAADMKPGLWEYTSKMEMPGMPFAMPPQASRQCLTQADVDKGKVGADPAGQQQNGCQVKNFKQSGNKLSYDVACEGSTSHAEFTTTATTMEGITMTDAGDGQKMTMRMTGKRIGECQR